MEDYSANHTISDAAFMFLAFYGSPMEFACLVVFTKRRNARAGEGCQDGDSGPGSGNDAHTTQARFLYPSWDRFFYL